MIAEWRFHSEYCSHGIFRLYDGKQAKMMYKSDVCGEELTAMNLAGIKDKVKKAHLAKEVA